MSLFRSRTQPWETACPISHGVFVPWTPTTPPPGQSESFEYPLVSNANAPRIGYLRGHEARLDEEEPGRRLHPSRADRDGAGPPERAVDVELELPRAAVDRRASGRRESRRPPRPGSSPSGRWGVPGPRCGTTSARRCARPARRGRARCAGGSRAGTASSVATTRASRLGALRTATLPHASGPEPTTLTLASGESGALPPCAACARERRQRPPRRRRRAAAPAAGRASSAVDRSPRPRHGMRPGRGVLPPIHEPLGSERLPVSRPVLLGRAQEHRPIAERGANAHPVTERHDCVAHAHPRAARLRDSVPHRWLPLDEARSPHRSKRSGS